MAEHIRGLKAERKMQEQEAEVQRKSLEGFLKAVFDRPTRAEALALFYEWIEKTAPVLIRVYQDEGGPPVPTRDPERRPITLADVSIGRGF